MKKKISGAGVPMLTSINLALMCITTLGFFFGKIMSHDECLGLG